MTTSNNPTKNFLNNSGFLQIFFEKPAEESRSAALHRFSVAIDFILSDIFHLFSSLRFGIFHS